MLVFLAALVAPGRVTWNVAQRCLRFFFRVCRIPVAVQGLENLPPSGPYVVASNHTSYLDGAVLVAVLPWRRYAFVAKRELADNFFSRVLVRGLGAVFVERFDVQRSAEHADALVQAARDGVSLIVFPEGTLMRHSGLMPFRAGAFQVAAQAGIPVVPVSLRGVRSVLRDETWYPRRAPIAATFAAPIVPDGDDWNAVLRLRDRTRAEILQHCGERDLDA
jgi:1-acyl-sn-glycerol-3-phosphate acyltransferase